MKANRAGKIAEDLLGDFMRSVGLEFQRQVVIGQSIYGTQLKVDFVVDNMPSFPDGLVIESKWQDVGGSVDEKFPYLYENIRTHRYPMPVALVIMGGGCRPGAKSWLRERVDRQHLVDVFSLEEFISWAHRRIETTTAR